MMTKAFPGTKRAAHSKLHEALLRFNYGACIRGRLVLFRPIVRNHVFDLRTVWYEEPSTMSPDELEIVEGARVKARAALDALVKEISS